MRRNGGGGRGRAEEVEEEENEEEEELGLALFFTFGSVVVPLFFYAVQSNIVRSRCSPLVRDGWIFTGNVGVRRYSPDFHPFYGKALLCNGGEENVPLRRWGVLFPS